MLRIILINLFFLLLPTLIYIIYTYVVKNGQVAISEAPVIALFSAGALLMLISIGVFMQYQGGKPGQKYYPPQIKDGVLAPGRTE